MARFLNTVTQLPAPAQHGANGAAATTAVASLFDLIHGPLSVVVLILSAVWLCLQIYGWVEKRRKGK